MSFQERANKYKKLLNLETLIGQNIRCNSVAELQIINSYGYFSAENLERTRTFYFGNSKTNQNIYCVFIINDAVIDCCISVELHSTIKSANAESQPSTARKSSNNLRIESGQAFLKHYCVSTDPETHQSHDPCDYCRDWYNVSITSIKIHYFDDHTVAEDKIKTMFCTASGISLESDLVTVSPITSPEDLPSLSQDVSKAGPSIPTQASVLTSTIEQQIQTLKNYKAIILEGVPGTGKTYGIGKIVEHWNSQTGRKVKGNASGNYAITMHPSTSYEDFVEGLRPNTDGKNEGELFHTANNTTKSKNKGRKKSEGFSYQDGFFKRICKEAANDSDHDYLVLLDEFNRCNIPKVMGDLLTTLESSKRIPVEKIKDLKKENQYQTITLPYSKEIFFVPDNVYVIGTMNTTDRSVAPLDSALRRRFAFIRVWPMGFTPSNEQSPDEITKEIVSSKLSRSAEEHVRYSIKLYHEINSVLIEHGQDVLIGHSYLYDLQRFLEDVESETQCLEITKMVWNQSIFPQLIDSLRKNNLLKLLDKDEKLDKDKKRLPVLQDYTIKGSGSGFQSIPTLLFQKLPQVASATKSVEKKA